MDCLFQKDQNLRLFVTVVVAAASKTFEAEVSDPSSSSHRFLSLLLFNADIRCKASTFLNHPYFACNPLFSSPKTCQVDEILFIMWIGKEAEGCSSGVEIAGLFIATTF